MPGDILENKLLSAASTRFTFLVLIEISCSASEGFSHDTMNASTSKLVTEPMESVYHGQRARKPIPFFLKLLLKTTRVVSHVGHDTKPLVPWEKRIFQDWKGWQVAGSGCVKPVVKEVLHQKPHCDSFGCKLTDTAECSFHVCLQRLVNY